MRQEETFLLEREREVGVREERGNHGGGCVRPFPNGHIQTGRFSTAQRYFDSSGGGQACSILLATGNRKTKMSWRQPQKKLKQMSWEDFEEENLFLT